MEVDLATMFEFDVPPLEMFIRGTVMYWFIFGLLRFAGRRDFGSIGLADILVLMLVADAAGNAMAGESESLSAGMIVVGTIILWSVFIDRIGYFFPRLEDWLMPDKVLLVRDGVVQRRGMRSEYLTMDELMTQLRQNNIENLSEVKRAYMEADGNISVITRKRGGSSGDS